MGSPVEVGCLPLWDQMPPVTGRAKDRTPLQQHCGCCNALSRDCLSNFLQVVPKAEKCPAAIPEPLYNLTIKEQPDWITLAHNTLTKVVSGMCARITVVERGRSSKEKSWHKVAFLKHYPT